MKNMILIVLIALLSSCNKNIEAKSPQELFDEYKGSVVLIATEYYYEIDYDGSKLYYSPSSENKIFVNRDDVLQNLSFSTGTGFIISENGEILTNRHVVSPEDKSYQEALNIFKNNMRELISYDLTRYKDTLETIRTYYENNGDYMDYYERERINSVYKLYLEKVKELNFEDYTFQYSDVAKATAKPVIVKLGIAFNDTHVSDFTDLQECVLIKTASEELGDLALIQTKTKKFNSPPNKIFNLKDNNPNIIENPSENKERDIKNPIKINDDVFMIGYNRGFTLASTKQGIKTQFTSGKISQENDGDRILYTIPTLEGSSGSPIIDKWGNLVGVNFAKLNNTQNFSFGVPVHNVKKFIEN